MAKRPLRHHPLLSAKLTVRQEQPWHTRFALLALVSVLVLGALYGAYVMGKRSVSAVGQGGVSILELQEQISELTSERDQLRKQTNTIDSKLNIDRSMQKELMDQVKTLTADNQKLKDDLAFFESFMQAGTGPDGVAVQNLKAELVAPGQLRYRALLVQGVKKSSEFSGEMQLTLNLVQAGKPVTMLFPDPKSGEAAKLKLSFKHYQRMEGVIPLPEDATVKSVQVKVLERGQQRAQQTINVTT
ncbi:DUF6776 family protein [Undibacterium curvum]|uniref:Uncharacterized protein n=1 Tax=Undibacterium curvum TaxID=2762294 RepID=A0ABR7A2C5_9BURK|nr:DUF6776 family protein [Undibacterium curvum]MBC3931061.1 hypothetical protein [Undibacterium curvum]